jgi:DNA-directed RNA polymerase specialized sigma subunit
LNIENILREYPHIPETIQKLNKELNDYLTNKYDTYNTLKSAKVTGMPHASGISNQTYNAVEKLIDRYGVRIKEITEEINNWMDLQKSIDDIFYQANLLTMEERRVIELRYFQQRKWTQIPYIMKYSKRSCEYFQSKAIEKIAKGYGRFAENCGKCVI